ncbi:hypothetical protein [Fluviicola sp.]|uniref:hypothetical protein n=1 Tax=Fluviicola sp. TaxID=1917219 RepID=UPI0031DF6432
MKNSEQNQLDQLLKDKLSEGTAQVPGFVWDRIEEELFPEKKRRGFFWWLFGGCCILLITAFIVIAVSGQGVHSQDNSSLNSNFNAHNYREQDGKKQVLNDHRKAGNIVSDIPKTTGSSGSDSYLDRGFPNQGTKPGKSRAYTTVRSNQNSRQKPATYFKQGKPGSSSSQTMHNSNSVGNNFTNLLTAKKVNTGKEVVELSTQQTVTFKDTNTITRSATENKAKTHIDSSEYNELSYLEILALAEKDFAEKQPTATENKRHSIFSLGISGGPSLYHSAVFKDYFTSGQLSKRTFASSGFELGLQARFKVGDRFKIYAGLVFNQKQTQFTYNLAITQADYFTYVVNNEKVPLQNIRDDGANSCFLAKDVTARYQMQSVLLSVGTSFEFLRIGKFSAAADLRLSGNLFASLKLKEIQVVDIAQPQSESFSYLQPGAGLSLNYNLNKHISLGVTPLFSKQFYLKTSFSRKLDELVIPLTVSFKF